MKAALAIVAFVVTAQLSAATRINVAKEVATDPRNSLKDSDDNPCSDAPVYMDQTLAPANDGVDERNGHLENYDVRKCAQAMQCCSCAKMASKHWGIRTDMDHQSIKDDKWARTVMVIRFKRKDKYGNGQCGMEAQIRKADKEDGVPDCEQHAPMSRAKSPWFDIICQDHVIASKESPDEYTLVKCEPADYRYVSKGWMADSNWMKTVRTLDLIERHTVTVADNSTTTRTPSYELHVVESDKARDKDGNSKNTHTAIMGQLKNLLSNRDIDGKLMTNSGFSGSGMHSPGRGPRSGNQGRAQRSGMQGFHQPAQSANEMRRLTGVNTKTDALSGL